MKTKPLLRIGIVGSRQRDSGKDKQLISDWLVNFMREHRNDHYFVIVSGGCPYGGDRMADELAKSMGLAFWNFRPDKWDLPDDPKRWDYANINYARNYYIAEHSDILVALRVEKKGGTDNTVSHYRKLGKTRLIDL